MKEQSDIIVGHAMNLLHDEKLRKEPIEIRIAVFKSCMNILENELSRQSAVVMMHQLFGGK